MSSFNAAFTLSSTSSLTSRTVHVMSTSLYVSVTARLLKYEAISAAEQSPLAMSFSCRQKALPYHTMLYHIKSYHTAYCM